MVVDSYWQQEIVMKYLILLLFLPLFIFAETSSETDFMMTKAEFEECYKNKEKTEQRFLIRENGKTGFIDGCGRVVIKPIYDSAFEFSEGAARVEKDGKVTFIDKSGKTLNISSDKYNGFKTMNFYFEKSSYRIPPKEPCKYSNHLLCLNRGKKVYFFRDYSGQEFQPSIIGALFPESEEAKIPSVWDEIDRWKKMDAEEEVKKLTKTNIRKCDSGITIKETLKADGFRETTTIYDENNKIIRHGDLTAWCPEGNLLKYRENSINYIYDTRKEKVVFEFDDSIPSRKYQTLLEIFDNKLLVRNYNSAADWGFQLFSADDGKVFLKLKDGTTDIALPETATKNIRILKWQGKIYYLNEDYKAFWSGKYEGNMLKRK